MFRRLLVVLLLSGLIFLNKEEFLFSEEESPNQVEFKDEGLRDPFISLLPKKDIPIETIPISIGNTEVDVPVISIQGMVWGVDRPQAIIDNKVYDIGDEIKGAKIMDISKEGVKFLYQDKIFLMAPEIRQKTFRSQN